ncbi:MAG: 30S ribosomal protein S18 [Actinobacteria bacterium]|nr:30S ribosomal protein S18 [Actinomycetota bacterium]
MARKSNDRKSNDRERKDRNSAPSNLRQRKKYCFFCKENIENVDYKNTGMLERHISDRGKIRPRRSSGNCVQHQRKVAVAIKRARVMALIPYFKR